MRKDIIKYLFVLLLVSSLIEGCSDEPRPTLNGIWILVQSKKEYCENSSMNHDLRSCIFSATNSCTHTLTDSTWTTELDTTFLISVSYRGDGDVIGGSITELNGKDCTQRYAENTCITDFVLTKNSLTLIQTGKINTPDKFCLIVKEFTRK